MYNRRDILCIIVGIRSKIVYAASCHDALRGLVMVIQIFFFKHV